MRCQLDWRAVGTRCMPPATQQDCDAAAAAAATELSSEQASAAATAMRCTTAACPWQPRGAGKSYDEYGNQANKAAALQRQSTTRSFRYAQSQSRLIFTRYIKCHVSTG